MRIATVVWLVMAALVANPLVASAANTLVAVVDVRKAMTSTKHWKDARSKLEAQKGELEGSLETKRKALKEKADALMNKRDVLAKDAFAAQARTLEKEQQALAQQLYQSQQKLAFLEKGYAGQMIKRIENVVRGIAYQKKYLVIVDTGDGATPNVLYAKKSADITPEVIKNYEKTFGKQDLVDPAKLQQQMLEAQRKQQQQQAGAK